MSLCLTRHHAVKAYGGVEVQLHVLLTLAVDGGEMSLSRPGQFTPGTHWTGGWVGPRDSMDAVEKRKIPSAHRESNPDHLDLQAIP
jgi:hypothetical protein